MRFGKTPVFITIIIIMLSVLAGGIISQIPSALGDNSDSSNNPFGALWDAIFDLQSKDKNLQAQIDELRAEKDNGLPGSTQAGEPAALASDVYARIRVETAAEGGDGQSSSAATAIVYITAGNNGPDRAAGIKLTTFYLMPLFQITSIDSSSGGDGGGLCEDKSRGIIECTLGTLEAGQESLITIHATAREFGKANTWTVDISTTTKDTDYTNNHVTYNFETGSSAIPILLQQQPLTNESGIDEEPQGTEPEKNGLDNNNNNSSNSTDADTSAEQTTENNDSANQNQTTSAEPAQATVPPSTGSNGTGTEQGGNNSGGEESSEEEQAASSSSSSSEESNGDDPAGSSSTSSSGAGGDGGSGGGDDGDDGASDEQKSATQ